MQLGRFTICRALISFDCYEPQSGIRLYDDYSLPSLWKRGGEGGDLSSVHPEMRYFIRVKEDEDFNRRDTLGILRIKI